MDLKHHLTQPLRVWLGGGGETKAFMFLCTQKHCTLIACHQKHCTLNIVLAGAGGETKAFMFLCTQKHCTLIACHQKHCTLNIVLAGAGGDKSVHVPLHTKALHLDRLSSEALRLEHSLGRGGGETKAFMFLCTQKHCTLIACHQKHCTLNIVLGRGGGGQKRSCSSAHKSTAPWSPVIWSIAPWT